MTNQEYRLDLHTHSIISYDGGITSQQYRRIFDDASACVAITDHNEISLALDLNKELGGRVIVGEEILSAHGELIGLFLSERIEPGFSALATAQKIREQNGLVYVPHPFEKTRKGLQLSTLREIVDLIDIIEIFNARTREPWLAKKNEIFANEHNIAQAASSDAHGIRGFGSAHSILAQRPSKENLIGLLKQAALKKTHAPLVSLLDPARNKFRKLLHL